MIAHNFHGHAITLARPTAARSHSLSRSYRAVLPTSLGRVIPSPEVVRLGDLLRFSVRSELVRAPFQGAARRACVPRAVLLRELNSSVATRRVMPARRPATLTGDVGAALLSPSRPAAGMCACVPFGACGALAVRLGPGYPPPIAVAHGNLLHLGGASSTVATPTEIWTGARSRWPQGRRSIHAPPRPTWLIASAVWVAGCSAINFPGARIRQVSCNTLLGGCRL